MNPYQARIEAAVSRLRPLLNAATTNVFGMAPLLQDVFWCLWQLPSCSWHCFGRSLRGGNLL
jgi:multidrug efflux pump subunit AcrB